MTNRTLTITLPDPLYEQLAARSARSRRPLEDETIVLLSTSLVEEALSPAVEEWLEQMALLSDAELTQAATVQATDEESARMQMLLEKQQRAGLTADEQRDVEQLAAHFERIMLTRAEATRLLRERRHSDG